MANYKWTPEQDAFLRVMFQAGASFWDISKAINEKLGTDYSESSVQSHAYWIGLRRPGNRPAVVWSADQNDELRRRIENKERYVDISEAMEIKYSAIVTQVYRLGIVRPSRAAPQPAAPKMTTNEARSLGPQNRHLRNRLNALLNAVPDEYLIATLLPTMPDPVLNPRNLTLAEVGRLECHWITNDDVTAPHYCGHAVEGGQGSWCPAHRNVIRRGEAPFVEASSQSLNPTRAGSGPRRCAAVA